MTSARILESDVILLGLRKGLQVIEIAGGLLKRGHGERVGVETLVRHDGSH
jgi:hypothetical protein